MHIIQNDILLSLKNDGPFVSQFYTEYMCKTMTNIFEQSLLKCITDIKIIAYENFIGVRLCPWKPFVK